jgi:hypothetical protein
MNLASRWVDYSISPAQVGIATAQYNGKFLNRVRKAQKAVSSRLSNVMFVDAMEQKLHVYFYNGEIELSISNLTSLR